MLAESRRRRIVEIVDSHRSVSVTALMEELQVSDMTVRRDLALLDSAGLLRKVHGGAEAISLSLPSPLAAGASHSPQAASAVVEPLFSLKVRQQAGAKAEIASVAAGFAEDGACIGLSAGTTTAGIAAHLAGRSGLTVVTNSLAAERALASSEGTDEPSPRVILTGGERTPSDSLIGPIAEHSLQTLHLDWLFVGCFAAHPERGLFTPNVTEAALNRAFLSSASRVCAVFDATKWETATVAGFAGWEQVDVLITDTLPASVRRALIGRVGRIIETSALSKDRREPGLIAAGQAARATAAAAPLASTPAPAPSPAPTRSQTSAPAPTTATESTSGDHEPGSA